MPSWKQANIDDSIAGTKEIRTGVPFFTPKGEKNKTVISRVRVLPPRDDAPDDKFYIWAATHGNLPGAGFPVYCPDKMANQPCDACIVSRQAYARGDKETGRLFGSGFRALMNVIPLNNDGSMADDAEVLVWGAPKRDILEALLEKIGELPPERRDITHPLTGSDVLIRRKGTGTQDTKYEVAIAPQSSELTDEQIEMLDTMHDLTTVYETVDNARIKVYLLEAPADGEARPALTAGDAFPEASGPDDAIDAEFEELFGSDDSEADPADAPAEEPQPAEKLSAKDELKKRLAAQGA